jgi:hypothetical protein
MIDDDMIDFVEIYCDDVSHPTKRVLINRLNQRSRWGLHAEVLLGDTPLRTATLKDGTGLRLRQRSDFRCELCGDTVVVRSEQLSPMLEKLLLHGVAAISLSALRARVSK